MRLLPNESVLYLPVVLKRPGIDLWFVNLLEVKETTVLLEQQCGTDDHVESSGFAVFSGNEYTQEREKRSCLHHSEEKYGIVMRK